MPRGDVPGSAPGTSMAFLDGTVVTIALRVIGGDLDASLTATVLAAAPTRHAGVSSGINNAIAPTGGLLAVAALPAAVGLSRTSSGPPAAGGAASPPPAGPTATSGRSPDPSP